MAESVDALVSNTSGATRAGSTPALGTGKGGFRTSLFLYPPPGPNPFLFLVRHSEQGGPPGPLSLAYSLRPNTFSCGLGVDGTDGTAFVAIRGVAHRRITTEPDSVCVVPTTHQETTALMT